MKKIFARIVTLSIILAFGSLQTAFAQAVPDVVAAEVPAVIPAEIVTAAPTDAPDAPVPSEPIATPEVETTVSETPSAEVGADAATVQETFNVQDGTAGASLESTTNPETATSTESDVTIVPLIIEATSTDATTTPVVLDQSTTTEETIPVPDATLDVVTPDIESVPVVEETVADPVSVPEPVPEPIVIDTEELEPSPDFAFALTGRQIPTKRKVENAEGKIIREEAVSAPLSSTVDNANGVMHVSGSCTDAYFVVLLFKNQDDYADDPSSYIVNRAYPCVAGAYSYSISELPFGLKDGTYYLLIGQQGERGAWTPITGLTEISINNNQ